MAGHCGEDHGCVMRFKAEADNKLTALFDLYNALNEKKLPKSVFWTLFGTGTTLMIFTLGVMITSMISIAKTTSEINTNMAVMITEQRVSNEHIESLSGKLDSVEEDHRRMGIRRSTPERRVQ